MLERPVHPRKEPVAVRRQSTVCPVCGRIPDVDRGTIDASKGGLMNRRDTLAMFGAGLLGGEMLAAAAPAAISAARSAARLDTLDVADPRDVARIFRRLAWGPGEGFGIWWLKGRRYAAVPPTYVAFWDMLIGTLFTVSDLDAQTYSVRSLTTTFYTDIASGALLDTFHNPVTGREVKVSYQPPRASEQRFGLHGRLEDSPPIPGTTASRSVEPGPAFIEGGDVWLRADFAARAVPTDVTRPAFQVEDLSTYFGALKDVADPAATEIPAGQVFTDLLNYPAWLEMGDRSGHFFSRCFGRKVFTTDAMPQDWRRLMAEHHPDILQDPRAALRG
jgi:hypothetical protein